MSQAQLEDVRLPWWGASRTVLRNACRHRLTRFSSAACSISPGSRITWLPIVIRSTQEALLRFSPASRAGERNWNCCPPGQRQASPARQGIPLSSPGISPP